MKVRLVFLLAFVLGAAADAHAYCVQNELPNRDVFVEQAQLKDNLREDQILRIALKPGQKHCCRNLSCNPGGRSESTVELYVTVMGEPEYQCAPEKLQTVKVTGDGLLRVQKNAYKSELSPFVVRIRSGEKDLTGPRGVTCLQKKGKS